MSEENTRDQTNSTLNSVSEEISNEMIGYDFLPPRTFNKRKQSDTSFIVEATKKAELYYEKLKKNERIPTFYLDIPCPQCGNKTNGHGQKHRVERKCRVCMYTFQLDKWLSAVLENTTPLKFYIDKAVPKLKITKKEKHANIFGDRSFSDEETEEAVKTQKELEELGDNLKKEMQELKSSQKMLQSLCSVSERQLKEIKAVLEEMKYNELEELVSQMPENSKVQTSNIISPVKKQQNSTP